MKGLKAVLAFLRSRTLTVWLVGLFVVYYLTMAVWIGEAFGRYILHLSSSNLFRAYYLLFLLNILFRSFDALKGAWPVRSKFFLRLPLLVGLTIFVASVFLSLNVRKTLWLPPVGEGDVISFPWEGRSYKVVAVEPALKKKALRTDDAAVFDYEPGIIVQDEGGRRFTIGAFPPARVGTTYLHVLNFGIGPGIELRKNDAVVWKMNVALRLTPFGVVDAFEVPDLPYKFYLSIVPNHLIKKGKETARDYDLERPRYQVEIVKGDQVMGREETDSELSFDGSMSLRFFPPADWVLLEAAYDPFLPLFVASLGLLILGVVLYPLSLLKKGAH